MIGGPVDLAQLGTERPEMPARYLELMPGFDRDGQALMRERSALSFAEQLNAPLLILHGGADARVPAGGAYGLGRREFPPVAPFQNCFTLMLSVCIR